MPATALPMSGLSWLAVEPTASLPSAVTYEPGPAGAEAGGAGLGEVFLELGEAAELRVDRGGELALGGAALARAMTVQKNAWLAVAAGVVADAAADGLGHLAEIGDERVHIERRERRVVLEEIVGVGDVGLVVLAVVDLHRLRVDVRSEGIESVGQFRKFEGHGSDF
jgi:hypothetical protein